MPKTRKRAVAVAKDVLARMDSLNICEGEYIVRPAPTARMVLATATETKRYAEKLQDVGCRVCILGACFLSFAKLFNGATARAALNNRRIDSRTPVESADRRDIVTEVLRVAGGFDRDDLDLMEISFERATQLRGNALSELASYDHVHGFGYCEEHADSVDYRRVVDALYFVKAVDEPVARARLVMENVIANNGRFVPPSAPDDWYGEADA